MQDPNAVSLGSLLKTLVKLRKVKLNGVGWATYSEKLLKEYKKSVKSVKKPSSLGKANVDASQFFFRFKVAETLEDLLSVINDISCYGSSSEKRTRQHDMYFEHLVISGQISAATSAPPPSTHLDYDGVLEVYELFQSQLDEIRERLEVSPEMRSDYEKAARAEYLYNLGLVTSYVAGAASAVGIKTLFDVVMSQAKIQGNRVKWTIEDVTDVLKDIAKIDGPAGSTPPDSGPPLSPRSSQ